MDTTARLWDVNTGAPVATLADHTGELVSVAFNSTGELLLTGSFDRTARVWDVRTGQCVHNLEGHSGEVCTETHMHCVYTEERMHAAARASTQSCTCAACTVPAGTRCQLQLQKRPLKPWWQRQSTPDKGITRVSACAQPALENNARRS
jgi:hypothetical protein